MAKDDRFTTYKYREQADAIADILGVPRGETAKEYKKEIDEISSYFVEKLKEDKYCETLPDSVAAVEKEIKKAMKLNNLWETDRTIKKVLVLKEYFAFRKKTDEIKSDFQRHCEKMRSDENVVE